MKPRADNCAGNMGWAQVTAAGVSGWDGTVSTRLTWCLHHKSWRRGRLTNCL